MRISPSPTEPQITSAQFLEACRRGDVTIVDSYLSDDCEACVRPADRLTEGLLLSVAWSRVDVVRRLVQAGVSTSTRASVATPGGSGIPNADTRHISAFELASMMKAGRQKHAVRIHDLVAAPQQPVQRHVTVPAPPSRKRPCASSDGTFDDRTHAVVGQSPAGPTSQLFKDSSLGPSLSAAPSAFSTAQPSTSSPILEGSPRDDDSEVADLRKRVATLEKRLEETRSAFLEQGRLLRTLYDASAAAAAVLAKE